MLGPTLMRLWTAQIGVGVGGDLGGVGERKGHDKKKSLYGIFKEEHHLNLNIRLTNQIQL